MDWPNIGSDPAARATDRAETQAGGEKGRGSSRISFYEVVDDVRCHKHRCGLNDKKPDGVEGSEHATAARCDERKTREVRHDPYTTE